MVCTGGDLAGRRHDLAAAAIASDRAELARPDLVRARDPDSILDRPGRNVEISLVRPAGVQRVQQQVGALKRQYPRRFRYQPVGAYIDPDPAERKLGDRIAGPPRRRPDALPRKRNLLLILEDDAPIGRQDHAGDKRFVAEPLDHARRDETSMAFGPFAERVQK